MAKNLEAYSDTLLEYISEHRDSQVYYSSIKSTFVDTYDLNEEETKELFDALSVANIEVTSDARTKVAIGDALTQYTREIREYDLLDSEEWFRLAPLIQKGLKAQSKIDVIEQAEIYRIDERELAKKYDEGVRAEKKLRSEKNKETIQKLKKIVDMGEDAKYKLELMDKADKWLSDLPQLLIEAEQGRYAEDRAFKGNVRLVFTFVQKYRDLKTSLTYSDIIQEGNVGLMKAIRSYDPNKGVKFSTYARFKIQGEVIRENVTTGTMIRIPDDTSKALQRLLRVKKVIESDIGRELTKEEILEEFPDMTERKLKNLLAADIKCSSIDIKVGENEDTTILDLISNKEDEVEQQRENKELKNALEDLLLDLGSEERMVLRTHFGLIDGVPKTFTETSKILGLTPNYCEKAVQKSLCYLRGLVKISDLEIFKEKL